MMNHPQQLLAAFLSHIWKIKRFITQSITSATSMILSRSGKYHLLLLVSWIITQNLADSASCLCLQNDKEVSPVL